MTQEDNRLHGNLSPQEKGREPSVQGENERTRKHKNKLLHAQQKKRMLISAEKSIEKYILKNCLLCRCEMRLLPFDQLTN